MKKHILKIPPTLTRKKTSRKLKPQEIFIIENRPFFYLQLSNYWQFSAFTIKGLLEVATESWPEWYLNPQHLNSVQML